MLWPNAQLLADKWTYENKLRGRKMEKTEYKINDQCGAATANGDSDGDGGNGS